jgi:phage FluMu gp28-like protein
MDATGLGNMLVEGLRDSFGDVVMPIEFTNESKEGMVMGLKETMFNDGLVLPNDPMLINNIRSIKRKFTSGGFLRFDSDRTGEIGHADLFWALALGVFVDGGGTTDFVFG